MSGIPIILAAIWVPGLAAYLIGGALLVAVGYWAATRCE